MQTTIALLTDFGTRDWFVASMKGVILGINPNARIVDVTHDIDPGSIASAAFVLRECFECFPEGTVFCVVVDPGVGSGRRALAAQAAGRLLVAPDNGVLSYVLSAHAGNVVRCLDNTALFRTPMSATFHGRDVFAPAAAHLSLGVPLSDTGPAADDLVRIKWPAVEPGEGTVTGAIVYIDHFGNAFTNITQAHAQKLGPAALELTVGSHPPVPLMHHYAAAAVGEALALVNSSGLIELAIRQGNAAQSLGLATGMRAELRVCR